MSKYLQGHGIISTRSAPYAPQQNGIVERMNRSLVEIIRVLLKSSGLINKFWAEALQCTVDIRNNKMNSSFNGITPFTALTGRVTDLHRFCIFDCLVCMHVPDQGRKMLEASQRKVYC